MIFEAVSEKGLLFLLSDLRMKIYDLRRIEKSLWALIMILFIVDTVIVIMEVEIEKWIKLTGLSIVTMSLIGVGLINL